MRSNRASRTAEHNALFRAMDHAQAVPIVDDPLARRFLSGPLSVLCWFTVVPCGGYILRAAIDRRWPGVRASVIARTRLIDDTLMLMPVERLGQLVILGAGLDSRPYRLDRLRQIPVFEVDHPATQHAKRQALNRTFGPDPSNVSFIPTDFNLGQLRPAMEACGYRSSVPTVFIWEGVTNYLTAEAVDSTVRWCAQAASGSTVIFTYIHSEVLAHPENYVGGDRLNATLLKVGERLTFGMDPVDVGAYLADRGLDLQWDLGATEYRSRYFGERSRTIFGHEFYRVALAHST